MNHLHRAIELRESGQYEEARALLADLREQQPNNPTVWYQSAWIHDVMGLESEAVPYYEQSIQLGLSGDDKQGALLGLGSTYRTLGMYEEARRVFEGAIQEYPDRREFRVFYAMVLYNLKEHAKAMEMLLQQLAETSHDAGIQSYEKAIKFYSSRLDELWN